MTIDTSKLVTYILSGDAGGIQTSKIVAYLLMEVGTEAGATPPAARQGYAYVQILRPPD